MCGRFTLGADTDRLIAEFGISTVAAEIQPRFNIAPTQPVAAVVEREGELRLGLLRWGLVPAWADDPSIASRMINARSESVMRKPAFRDAFLARRCVIPADGFYEWRREPDGSRTPMHIRLPQGRPFAFAGLWERWVPAEGSALHTCTILTTTAAPSIRGIHDRMPVILTPAASRDWLTPDASTDTLLQLARPYDGPLDIVPVSSRVNSPANDDPTLLTRVEPPRNILDGLV